MTPDPPSLRERIEAVETRVAERQERLPVRWHEAQRAASSLLRIQRTLPLVAIGVAVVVAYVVLRRPAQATKTGGGVLGALVTAGVTLLRPRYGMLYSLAWELLKKQSRSASARRPQP